MKKSVVINSTLAAANALLESFNKERLDNLSKWSYALVRYVLYRTIYHDEAVILETYVQELYADSENYQDILTKYINQVQEATVGINGNELIVNQPPFNLEWSPMMSQP